MGTGQTQKQIEGLVVGQADRAGELVSRDVAAGGKEGGGRVGRIGGSGLKRQGRVDSAGEYPLQLVIVIVVIGINAFQVFVANAAVQTWGRSVGLNPSFVNGLNKIGVRWLMIGEIDAVACNIM